MARILLLEEEPNIAGIVLFKLRREGHDVRWEERLDQAAAEAAAREHRPDLVIADLDGGHEAVAAALSPQWPVLGLTDGTDPLAEGRARAAGAIEAVPKPFKPTVLANVVARLGPALGSGNAR